MIKQTLFFTTPVCLSLRNAQLVISWKNSNAQLTRSIEDLGCVVLESPMISVTMPLFSALVANNVAVIARACLPPCCKVSTTMPRRPRV